MDQINYWEEPALGERFGLGDRTSVVLFGEYLNKMGQLPIIEKLNCHTNQKILKDAILRIIEIQTSLVVTPTESNPKDGFLISNLSFSEFEKYLQANASIYLAKVDSVITGYALLTELVEFTFMYTPHSKGVFIPNSHSVNFNFSNYKYLYQIGVDRNYRSLGIAAHLLTAIKRETDCGLLTDYLVSPLKNEASQKFFSKHKFFDIGTLHLPQYREFGALVSNVVVWTST